MRWVILALFAPLTSHAVEPAKRPNIVVILADDLGIGDLKCFNPDSKIATPNLDKLTAAGMKFPDAHSASGVCSPTRYGLLTGRYPWRSKLQSGVLGGLSPRLIEPNRETLASLLKANGYSTACFGKWHLGMDWELKPGTKVSELSIEPRGQVFNVEYTKPIKNGPNSVGFDYYFGISASLDMVPYTFIENDRVTADPTEDRDFAMRADRANGKTRKGPAAPGFEAANVLPEITKATVKWIGERAEQKKRVPFFVYMPLTAPHTPILPTKDFTGKTKLGPYAEFVMQTDHAVGEVLAALKTHGFDEDTLVIFTSDNGCSPSADFPDLAKHDHNPSYIYRGAKADVYEGGHRIPLLVRWPGVVKPDSSSDQLVCLNDLCRTGCEVAGVKVPDAAAEDSFSFLPVLKGAKSDTLRSSIVHHSINGSFAIRKELWKLLLCPGSGGWSKPRPGTDDASQLPPVQLFDLKTDIGETKNLQADQKEKVEELTKLLEKYVADGRSTPGEKQKNTVNSDIWKSGKAAMVPPKKGN